MVDVAVVGYGHWGPNLVRNFMENPRTNLLRVCDLDRERLQLLSSHYPQVAAISSYRDVLADGRVALVALATPVSTHFTLAKEALEAGKHVLIEKPLAATAAQASELIEVAAQKGLLIFVDHILIYTAAVRKLKELIEEGEIGPLYYFDAQRTTLGLYQKDTNVIGDLAPHDLAILCHLISEKPVSVSAVGANRVNPAVTDLAYLTVRFDSGFMAHLSVSWLHPVRTRTIVVSGRKRMVVFDDTQQDGKINIYDKGVACTGGPDTCHYTYRSGDLHVPRLDATPPLKVQVEHIADCLEKGEKPAAGGEEGLAVVRLMEAAFTSLQKDGRFINLSNY